MLFRTLDRRYSASPEGDAILRLSQVCIAMVAFLPQGESQGVKMTESQVREALRAAGESEDLRAYARLLATGQVPRAEAAALWREGAVAAQPTETEVDARKQPVKRKAA